MLKQFALVLILLGAFAAPLVFAQDESDSEDEEMQADEDTGFGDEDVPDEDVGDEDVADEDVVDEEMGTDESEDTAESDAEEESVGDPDVIDAELDDAEAAPETGDIDATADEDVAPPEPTPPKPETESTEAVQARVSDCVLGSALLVPPESVRELRGCWLADGRYIQIQSNQALFSLLGPEFGGDGRTNFALPDLRGLTEADGQVYCICTSGTFPNREVWAPIKKANCELQNRAKNWGMDCR